MGTRQFTIKVPLEVGRRVARAAKRQNRKPSDLAVEALKRYFSIPTETATPAELRAISRGEAALRRGNSITLDELRGKDEFRREEEMARRPRRARAKIS